MLKGEQHHPFRDGNILHLTSHVRKAQTVRRGDGHGSDESSQGRYLADQGVVNTVTRMPNITTGMKRNV